jgi:hypothetical protein
MARPKTSALVPAAARGGELLNPEEVELNSAAIDTFLSAVGGRTELTDVLSIGAGASDMDKVTQLLLDPRYSRTSLRRLCALAGITVADLFASYRKALVARAHIEATHVIASKLVPVVRDVMDRALTDPTVDRHKLALELGQLTEKKGGLIVQQNAIAAAVSTSATQVGALEQLQQAVGDLLFSPRKKSDVVRDDPPSPRTPLTSEEEPSLPFDDPYEDPPSRRRPDLPGEPEERIADDDDPDDDDVERHLDAPEPDA